MKIKVISLPIEEMKLRGGSVSVRNLQMGAEDVDGVRAMTVGRRFRRLSDKAMRPIGEGYFGSDEAWLLLTDEADNLYVMQKDITELVGKAPDKVNCAVATDGGWLVMTESVRLTVRRRDGVWQVERDRFAEPEIYFSALSHGTLHQPVAAMTLGDVDFSRTGSEISSRDMAVVTGKLLEAYKELTQRAADAGLRLQPLLARAELLDCAGRVIYTSLPRLVSCSAGWQCCTPVSAQCSKPSATELAVPSMMLSAEAYGVGVRVESLGSYVSEAASMRVTLTPQDHPVSFDQQALCRIVHPATDTPTLTVALPGTTASWADKTAARTERMRSLFDRFEYLKAYTVTIGAKLGDCGEPHFSQPLPADTEVAGIEKALTRSVKPTDGDARKSGYVTGFIAGCVAECGDTVVWGDLTQVRALAAAPYGALEEDADIEWSGTLRLTHSDGTVTDRLIGYPDRCPRSLAALAAYPDADVRRIDVWVHNLDTSTIGHAGCDLQPSADGSCAVAVTSDLQPIEFEQVSEYPETTSTAATPGRRQPGAVIVARSVQPLMPVTSLEITPARISALAPAVRSQSLDAARTKLYAFSQAGIFSITLPASRTSASATLLDSRGAADAPVTFTPEGVYFSDMDGGLRRITGSKVLRLPLKSRTISTARDGATGRLLVVDFGGKMFALDAGALSRYRIGLPSPALSLTDIAGRAYLTAQTGLYTLEDAGAENTDIEYAGRVELPYPSRIVAIEVDMAASRFKGKIAVGTDGGPGPEYSLDIDRFELDTAVNGRLIGRVVAPSLQYATVTVKGEVTPDFRLTDISLIVCRPYH